MYLEVDVSIQIEVTGVSALNCMDTFTRRKTYSQQKKPLLYRGTTLIGPVFMIGCTSVFYLYNIAAMMQQESEIRMRHSKANMGELYTGDLISKNTPWNSELLPELFKTHTDDSSHRKPCNARVSIIVDNTPAFNPFSQVEGLLQFAPPQLNLHVYVSVKPGTSVGHATEMNAMMNHSGVLADISTVDLTMLEVPSSLKHKTRAFRMAWHAMNDLQKNDMNKKTPGFVLLLHRSCVVDSNWDISTLLQGGRGFLFLHSDVSSKTLYNIIENHDLGITSGSFMHKNSLTHISVPFHCSGSIMHALHAPHVMFTGINDELANRTEHPGHALL